MLKRLERLDIPTDDVGDLFRMIDTDGGGTITVHEFIDGVRRFHRGRWTAKHS